MSQINHGVEPNTSIDEIAVVYDMSLAIANEPSYGIGQGVPGLLIPPEDSECAVLTNVDRQRLKRAYPKPSRTEPHPQGEDVFTL